MTTSYLRGSLLLLLLGACDSARSTAPSVRSLDGACVATATAIPSGALRCGADLVLECGATLERFYVTPSELGLASCADAEIETTPEVLSLGPNTVRATATSSGARSCTAQVEVEDTTPAVVEPQIVEAWPPNHQWLEVTAEACAEVYDACGATSFSFEYVSVDEPAEARGDGNTDPDVNFHCGSVAVRSERQGGGDGRIYRLHFRVEDAGGQLTRDYCEVHVAPNASKPAAWSGESYRVSRPDEDCDCGGSPSSGSINTGPLPAGCAKTEGGDLGVEGAHLSYGEGATATFSEWVSKTDDAGEWVGFDVTVTSTPAWVSVKAGGEEYGTRVDGTDTLSWRHPEHPELRGVPAISNIVVCPSRPCGNEGEHGSGESPDAGGPVFDAGSGSGGGPDAGVQDVGGTPDSGRGF